MKVIPALMPFTARSMKMMTPNNNQGNQRRRRS